MKEPFFKLTCHRQQQVTNVIAYCVAVFRLKIINDDKECTKLLAAWGAPLSDPNDPFPGGGGTLATGNDGKSLSYIVAYWSGHKTKSDNGLAIALMDRQKIGQVLEQLSPVQQMQSMSMVFMSIAYLLGFDGEARLKDLPNGKWWDLRNPQN